MKKTKFFRCIALLGFASTMFVAACSGGPDKSVTFTVSFNTDGGSAVEAQVVANEDYASKPKDPVKDGFVFENWYADSKCVTLFDFEKVKITSDWTLYANWTQRTTPYDPGTSETSESTPGSSSEPAATTTYTATGLPTWAADGGAKMFVYAWTDGQSNADWFDGDFNTGLMTVSFTVPNEMNKAIIVRADPSKASDAAAFKAAIEAASGDWAAAGKWNQTNDLDIAPGSTNVETNGKWQ